MGTHRIQYEVLNSHNEAETAKDEHLVAGAQVLLDVALTRAGTLNADS